jgi:hypothetical protein
MGEMGRREIAEMIKRWGGDEGASLVAARRTATLGRYTDNLVRLGSFRAQQAN